MSESPTAKSLFDAHHDRLELEWLAGHAGGGRTLDQRGLAQGQMPLIERLNCIHPSRIQVLGESEIAYMQSLGKNSRDDLLKQLFAAAPVAVIVADSEAPPPDLLAQAESTATPLFASRSSSRKLIATLRRHLSGALSEKTTLHGVFMEVKGIGVLLTGDSSVGKSELALELLSRGHRLIADDAPEFVRIGDEINGRCPPVLQDFIEVRGLGLLNVRALFGDSAIKTDKNLRLIVRLKPMAPDLDSALDRLQGDRRVAVLLDIEIPEITLPVAPGRNLAVLVEAAVSNEILLIKGYDAAHEFMKRQRKLIAGSGA